jgi:hypothetical protein
MLLTKHAASTEDTLPDKLSSCVSFFFLERRIGSWTQVRHEKEQYMSAAPVVR